MKKLTYSILAAATLLFAACARETQPAATDGQLADVTFQIGLDQVQTKAFSDGKTATSLDVMVFSANSATPVYLEKLTQNIENAFTGLKANVAMKLVKGETYKIAFWAHAPECPYTLDPATATITAATSTAANNEDGDAFFGVFEGKVTASLSESVTLKRPFAQVNILTTEADWTAAVTNNGIAFDGSSMALTAPTKLNLLTGAVSDEKAITFERDAITEAVNIAGYITGYKYIAMNYVLAPESNILLGETNKPFSFSVYREDQEDALFTTPMQNVPVRRNYRTVIAGDVFCVDATFEVSIVSAYDGTQTPENPDQSLIQATITASDKSVEVGKTVSLGATTNSTSALTYESLTPAVATVDANGVVTGVAEGSASIKISVAANDAYTAASKTVTVTVTAEQGGGDEPPTPAGITVDGNISEWATASGVASFTDVITDGDRILEWKAASDADNVYFLFKINSSKIKYNNGSYNYGAYLTIGFDTDNDSTTGAQGECTGSGTSTHGPVTEAGLEALALLYPWRGETEGSPSIVNGADQQGSIQCPVGTATEGKVTCYGVFDGDYCYLEVSVGREYIGSPTGTIVVNPAMSYYPAGRQEITLSDGTQGGGDEPPTPPTPPTGITVDGNISEWATASGVASFTDVITDGERILEWKAASDADNVYFLFKINSSKIKYDNGSYAYGAYLYIGFDTDNDSSTGDQGSCYGTGTSDHGPITVAGIEAVALLFPWRGETEGSPSIVNGVDANSWVHCPTNSETSSGQVTCYGVFDGDYCYLEVSIEREAIGSPTGTIVVNPSMSYYPAGRQEITLAE